MATAKVIPLGGGDYGVWVCGQLHGPFRGESGVINFLRDYLYGPTQ